MAMDISGLYPQPQKAVNPLELASQVQSLKNSMVQNRLLGQEEQQREQEIQGRLELGKILQENTDANGQVNQNGVIKAASQNPWARNYLIKTQAEMANANPLTEYMGTRNGEPTPMRAPLSQVRAMNNPAQTVSQKPQGPSPEEIKKLREHNTALIDSLQSLVDNPNLDEKTATRALVDLVANPAANFNATDAGMFLSQLPRGENGAPPSREQLMEAAQAQLAQQMKIRETLDHHYPIENSPAAQPVELSRDGNPIQESDSPGAQAGLPTGYTSPLVQSREDYNTVVETAKSAPQQNAAYNEVINLINRGTETGTIWADLKGLGARLIPGWEELKDEHAQQQELAKWMGQGLLANGMPSSDARLQELNNANINKEQLTQTIRELAPFFKAATKGTVEKQKFLNRETNNGTDLRNVPEALQFWNENFDPRWLELEDIKDQAEKKKFLKKHPDLLDEVGKLKALRSKGIL